MSDLTPDEKKWVKAVQKLLDKTPPRIGFFTIGDPELSLFDREKESQFDDSRDMVQEVDTHRAMLGQLKFKSSVHGVCG